MPMTIGGTIGGVIGFVEDGEYTPSLADNVVLNYVGFIVNNYKPFNIWATDENGELLTEKVYNYSIFSIIFKFFLFPTLLVLKTKHKKTS